MTDDLSRRSFLGAAALAAAAIDVPGLEVRRLLGSPSGLQPSPRAARLGYASGGADRVTPPEEWDVADGYGNGLDDASYLTDLVHLGLPNGDFSASDDDDDTSDYWEATNGSVSWQIVVDSTAPGGYVWRYAATTSTGATPATLLSARVPVTDVFKVAAAMYYDCTDATENKIDVNVKTLWYAEDETLLSTVTIGSLNNPEFGSKLKMLVYDQMENSASNNAATVALKIEVTHIAAGAAANLDIRTLALRTVYPPGLVLDRTQPIILSGAQGNLAINGGTLALSGDFYQVAGQVVNSSAVTVTPGSPVHNWNPGTALEDYSIVRADPPANLTATGLNATDSGKFVYLLNVSTFTITLKHQDAGSTAANRFSCPGGVDFVIGDRGGALLWYDSASSRWRIFHKS